MRTVTTVFSDEAIIKQREIEYSTAWNFSKIAPEIVWSLTKSLFDAAGQLQQECSTARSMNAPWVTIAMRESVYFLKV